MKNRTIGGILLLVAGVSILAIVSKKNNFVSAIQIPPQQSTEEANLRDEKSEILTGKGSLQALLAIGKSLECTFVIRTDRGIQEGTAFYDNGKIRIDTLLSGANTPQPIASYVIVDTQDKSVYVWDNGQGDQGIKLKQPTEIDQIVPATDDVFTNQTTFPVTPDTVVDYTCKSWQVDGSVFVPPSTRKFKDMTSRLE